MELAHAREIGAIEERSRNHSEDIHALREDVREIKDTLAEMKGAWKLGIKVAAGTGVVAGAVSTILSGWVHR